jgi:hypothetical protein
MKAALVFILALPGVCWAASPKPLASYCDQPQVVVQGATQDRVLEDIKTRLRSKGTSFVVTVPDTLESCLARCNESSALPDSPQHTTCTSTCKFGGNVWEQPRTGRVDIVIAVASLANLPVDPGLGGAVGQPLQHVRLQFMISEARTGIRVEAAAGAVEFPGSDHEVVLDYTRPWKSVLQAGLDKTASRLNASGIKPASPEPSDWESAAKVGLAHVELDLGPMTYVLPGSISPMERATVASVRKVIDIADVPDIENSGLPVGYALLQKIDVQSDNAVVSAIPGPTEPKMRCAYPATVHLKSERQGWRACDRQQMVC